MGLRAVSGIRYRFHGIPGWRTFDSNGGCRLPAAERDQKRQYIIKLVQRRRNSLEYHTFSQIHTQTDVYILTAKHNRSSIVRRACGGGWRVCIKAEITKRREAEIAKLQKELDETQAQNDTQLAAYRKKHQDSVNQFTEQIDKMHAVKQRSE